MQTTNNNNSTAQQPASAQAPAPAAKPAPAASSASAKPAKPAKQRKQRQQRQQPTALQALQALLLAVIAAALATPAKRQRHNVTPAHSIIAGAWAFAPAPTGKAKQPNMLFSVLLHAGGNSKVGAAALAALQTQVPTLTWAVCRAGTLQAKAQPALLQAQAPAIAKALLSVSAGK